MKTSSPFRMSCFAGLSALALAVVPAQATLFDFNSTGQLADNFRLTGATSIQPAQTGSGGIGNTGWIATSSNTGSSARTSVVSQASFSSQESFTLSVYFQWGGQSLGSTGELFALGIGKTATGDFTPISGSAGLSAPGVDQFQLGLGLWRRQVSGNWVETVRVAGSYVADDTLTNFTSGTGTAYEGTLTVGNWYYLAVDFTLNLAENGYNTQLRLVNSDANGVLGSNVITPYDYNFINADLVGTDFNVYLMHRSAPYSGALGFDNLNTGLEAIPEPSTVAIMMMGAACLGWKLRQKKNLR